MPGQESGVPHGMRSISHVEGGTDGTKEQREAGDGNECRGSVPVGRRFKGHKAAAFTVKGRLPGLNEFIDAERTNKYKAAGMKRDCETLVILSAKKLGRYKAAGPVYMKYLWVEKDRRRDLDNISGYGRKIIQDSLVKGGWLKDDGQKHVVGFDDDFAVDKGDPRIEIEIWEVDT